MLRSCVVVVDESVIVLACQTVGFCASVDCPCCARRRECR